MPVRMAWPVQHAVQLQPVTAALCMPPCLSPRMYLSQLISWPAMASVAAALLGSWLAEQHCRILLQPCCLEAL
jgi:hypothetical protein